MKTAIANRLPQIFRTAVVAIGFAFIGLPAISAQAGEAGQTCYFGECLSGTRAPATVSAKADPNNGFQVVAKQGSWSVLRKGQAVLVNKDFDDGAKFGILRVKAGYALVFMDPNWSLREGQRFKVSIDIDGKTYSGEAEATNGNMMVVAGIRSDFIDDFANGELVKFQMAGSTWTIVPANAAAVIKAAANS